MSPAIKELKRYAEQKGYKVKVMRDYLITTSPITCVIQQMQGNVIALQTTKRDVITNPMDAKKYLGKWIKEYTE